MLVEEAKRLGVTIQLDSEVQAVDFDQTCVILSSGETIHADVIIGADGTFLSVLSSPVYSDNSQA